MVGLAKWHAAVHAPEWPVTMSAQKVHLNLVVKNAKKLIKLIKKSNKKYH